MEAPLSIPDHNRGIVAPFVDRARALVLSDKATFDATLAEIKASIGAEVTPFVTLATARKITDAESYQADLRDGRQAASYIARIEELLDPLKADLHRLHKQSSDLIAALTGPLGALKDMISRRTGAWDRQEKERVRREQEAARLKAEAERRRIEEARIAEAQRVEAAARAKAEADREVAERERRETAATLEAAGNTEAAKEVLSRPVEVARDDESEAQIEAILSAPIEVTPDAVAPAAERVEGTSGRTYWKWRIMGETPEQKESAFKALLGAVLAGTVPLEAVTTNDTFLNRVATAMKGAMRYVGIEVYEEAKTTFRRG